MSRNGRTSVKYLDRLMSDRHNNEPIPTSAEAKLAVNTIIQVMGPGVIGAAELESIRRHAKEGARKSVDDTDWERLP